MAPLRLPFWLRLRDGIVRYWIFVPCNSENISCTTFLKHKNSRKQELALWHLVNSLVPENDKSAQKTCRNINKTSMEHQKLEIRLQRISNPRRSPTIHHRC